MQIFKRFFDFYINSSIHVSLAVVAMCWVTYLNLDISVNFKLLAFVFFSSVTGYNFVKYAEIAGLHHRSLAQSLKSIQIFSLVCGVGMVVLAFFMPLEVWVLCGILGFITLLYAVPFFLPTSRSRGNLRSISGIKIYIIALVWTGVTVAIPLVAVSVEYSWDIFILGLQRFLLVLALMIPFEIRDMQVDAKSLKTLPQVRGMKAAKVIGVVWLVAFLMLEFFKDTLDSAILVNNLILVVVLGLCITLSRKRDASSDYFASFWVEGIPILWLGSALVIIG